MDTKLKKYSRSWYVKCAAWAALLLCVGIITCAGLRQADGAKNLVDAYGTGWTAEAYETSWRSDLEFQEMVRTAMLSHLGAQNRERIKKGGWWTDSYLDVFGYYTFLCGEQAAITGFEAVPLPRDKEKAKQWKEKTVDPVVLEASGEKESGREILISLEKKDSFQDMEVIAGNWTEDDLYAEIYRQLELYDSVEYGIGQHPLKHAVIQHMEQDQDYQDFLKEQPYYREQTEAYRIRLALDAYDRIAQSASEYDDDAFVYYIKFGGAVTTNRKDNSPISALQRKCGIYSTNADGKIRETKPWDAVLSEWDRADVPDGISAEMAEDVRQDGIWFFGITNDYISVKDDLLSGIHEKMTDNMPLYGVGVALILLLLLYLTMTAGRKPESDQVFLCWFDRIYAELQIIGAGIAACVSAGFIIEGAAGGFDYGSRICRSAAPWVSVAGAAALAAVYLSLVRRKKAHRFMDGFLTARLARWMKNKGILALRAAREVWTGSRLMHKVMICAVLVPVISATWIGVLPVVAFLLYFGYKWVKDFEALAEGIKQIRDGDYRKKIQIFSQGTLRDFAEDVNQISDGLDQAVSMRLKAERMKTELISNVSHDIKTPLTAIITYVDLLKKEEITNEKAKEYIEILDQKSGRLKALTDDLFDAAKASSGAVELQLETMDFASLINQGLGEFYYKLEEKNLSVRYEKPEEPVRIKADGKQMWRVYENLLSNLVKYAMPGSRVYLSLEKRDSMAELTIKNISAAELNIPAEELTERFRRGDDSRHSEGSGLGLNIAQNLVELQNGTLAVQVDGDLFKVIVSMPLAE